MKTINIDGRELKYRGFHVQDDVYESWHVEFYEGTEEIKEKKYIFFGPTITMVKPKCIFRILENIDNPNLSKEWWKERIRGKLHAIERKVEIEKGDLI